MKTWANIFWLGIYVCNKEQSKGNGTIIMKYLLNYFNKNFENEQLYLTVHQNNVKALNLYKKFNFKIIENISDKNMYKMKLN